MSVNFKPALRVTLVSAFVAPLFAVAATPAPTPSATLYGGGATLPAIAYVGNSWLQTNGSINTPQQRLTSAADLGSLFGQYTAAIPPKSTKETNYPTVSYCQIGSGGARKIFYGLSGFDATQACGDYGSGGGGVNGTGSNKNGFSAPAGTEANFIASDVPLNASEYSQFITNKGGVHSSTVGGVTTTYPAHTEPVQVPEVAGAIGIIYSNSDSAVGAKINLTESQICQIFSGQITNWNGINPSFQNKPIVLVYRSDDSGTSFNFSNHLSTVCPTAYPTPVNSYFTTQSTFVNIYPSHVPPAGAITNASGNPGVVQAVQTNDGAIGYAEIQDAIERGNLSGSKVQYATVSIRPDIPAVKKTKTTAAVPATVYTKLDPSNLANVFKLPAGNVLTDMVITGNDPNLGTPVLASITSATGTAPPQTGCFFIADPAAIATAPTKEVTSGAGVTRTDYVSYPIVAVTYLMTYNTGNGANATNLGTLLAATSTGPIKSTVSTIGKNSATGSVSTGFAYLYGPSLPGGTPAAFAKTISSCVKS